MTQQSYRLGDHGPAVAQIRDHLALLGLLGTRAGERSSGEWDASFDADGRARGTRLPAAARTDRRRRRRALDLAPARRRPLVAR